MSFLSSIVVRARLPACLMAWDMLETERLRIALLECFAMVATLEASPKNISALATAAVSLNEKARALDRIGALNVEIGREVDSSL